MAEQVIKVAKSMQIWPFLVEFGDKLAQKPLIFDLLEHAYANISGLGYLSVPGSMKKHQKITFTLFHVKKSQEIGRNFPYLAQIGDICSNLAQIQTKIWPIWSGLQDPRPLFWVVAIQKQLKKPFFTKLSLVNPVV